MKKILLSVSLIAASSAYAAAQNHIFDQLLPQTGATTRETAQILSPTALSLPRVEVAQLAPAKVAPAVQAPAAATIVLTPPSAASAHGGLGVIQMADATPVAPSTGLTSPASTMPPLPRSRPDAAPQATIDVAGTAAPMLGPYRDGTYKGTSENAYYGRVQVQVVVTQGQVSAIKVLDYPQDRRTSRYINSQALPLLEREVMRAQDARINMISGATLTSNAYIHSLSKALSKARTGNA